MPRHIPALVVSAPGAGKSSILNEIARNPERLRWEGVPVPMVLMLKSGDIQGSPDILRPLAEKVHPSGPREFMAGISRDTRNKPQHVVDCRSLVLLDLVSVNNNDHARIFKRIDRVSGCRD